MPEQSLLKACLRVSVNENNGICLSCCAAFSSFFLLKKAKTICVDHSSEEAKSAIKATNEAGMAATAAKRIGSIAQVASTSASARCVESGASKARTKSSKRCDFKRGNAMRANSSESTQVFCKRGYPAGCFVVKVRSNSALWATQRASPTNSTSPANASLGSGAFAMSSCVICVK